MNLTVTKRTRFKLAVYTNVFLGLLSIYAIYVGMESVAITCIGGILTITTAYIGGNSYRDSQ